MNWLSQSWSRGGGIVNQREGRPQFFYTFLHGETWRSLESLIRCYGNMVQKLRETRSRGINRWIVRGMYTEEVRRRINIRNEMQNRGNTEAALRTIKEKLN